MKQQLPSPTAHADIAVELVSVGLATIPGGGGLSRAVGALRERRKQSTLKIILSELRNGNLDILTDQRAEVFVPAAYSVYLAADEGEHKHNVRLLARIMVSDENLDSKASRVPQSRHTLRGMSSNSLFGLNAFYSAFEQYKRNNPDEYNPNIDEKLLSDQIAEGRFGHDWRESESLLSEFVSRGLAKLTVGPGVIGGHFYAPTALAHDIKAETQSMIENGFV